MEVSMQESRMIESRNTTEKTYLHINPLIVSQIASFKNMWPDVDIRYAECVEDVKIFGEPSQLKLAIFNLLDNAYKYSTPKSIIDADCFTEKNNVVIKIRNQGIPITRKERETLFDKYERGRNSMNTSGAGLGLWLVKKIVEQHYGNVTLKGTSSGVEVTVYLPFADDIGQFEKNELL